MVKYYRFDDSDRINYLGNLSQQEAEEFVKAQLRLASRIPEQRAPNGVTLYDDGTELFRWTQRDRKNEEAP